MDNVRTRAPEPGELCSCGGQPIIVYVTDVKDVPYCGVPGGSGPVERGQA